MKKTGFTLAETLMTLTIIGIISAVTLPGLLAHHETVKLQSALKRTYLDLNDFAAFFAADKHMSVSEYTSRNGLQSLISEYSDYMAMIQKKSDYKWGDETKNRPYKIYQLKNQGIEAGLPCDAGASIYNKDNLGRTVAFDDAPRSGYNGPRICVDINGEHKPNIMGKDVFSFLFTTDGSVIPEGQEHPNNFTEDKGSKGFAWEAGTSVGPQHCYDSTVALTCAYYALNDISPKISGHKYWTQFIEKREYDK